MKKQFIPYELAVKLKELGFDESCFGMFYPDKSLGYNSDGGYNYDWSFVTEHHILAPLWQQAFDWFREKYNLYGSIGKPSKRSGLFYYDQILSEEVLTNGPYKTYEEARQACLEKLIEITEKK